MVVPMPNGLAPYRYTTNSLVIVQVVSDESTASAAWIIVLELESIDSLGRSDPTLGSGAQVFFQHCEKVQAQTAHEEKLRQSQGLPGRRRGALFLSVFFIFSPF